MLGSRALAECAEFQLICEFIFIVHILIEILHRKGLFHCKIHRLLEILNRFQRKLRIIHILIEILHSRQFQGGSTNKRNTFMGRRDPNAKDIAVAGKRESDIINIR